MRCDEFYREYLNIQNPYEFQVKTWQLIQEPKFPLLIKAPGGSGKTEAVVAPFLAQFVKNEFSLAPRLIYTLPIRALANTIAKRIEKYAKRISQKISVNVQHRDVHNSPFFIGDIIVTTLDQFLYGFARTSMQVGHHIDIPAGSIASSFVVFDEAHMYRDSFTFSIMRALMEILYESKVPFVVMTATMPDSLEESLFENIGKQDVNAIDNIPSLSKIDIKFSEEPLYAGEVNICDQILSKIKHKKTLIVLNQVKRAQKVYDEINKRLALNNSGIVLLHSRFTKVDREQHEDIATSLLPRKDDGEIKTPKGIGIVVSTQVLEAGIDFSAELLLTELAPADSLVQRAGRCARYQGEIGEMIIFPTEKENKGYLPYEKEPIERTREWLRSNPNFNIKDFNQVRSFVNETLNYRANDYEARDTLIDLYECVLYADQKPTNIQLRNGKPITLVVCDLSNGAKDKIEDKIKDAIRRTNIRENSIDVDIGVGLKLLNDDGVLKYALSFDNEKREWIPSKVNDISPFGYYLIDRNFYCPLKGVLADAESFII